MGQRHPGSDVPLDAASGRGASRDELRLRLAMAPVPYLEGAVENPEMSEGEMVLLLRNRSITSSLLTRIARDRKWARAYEIKKAVVRHPRTPYSVARNLLSHLYWRDLAEVAGDVRLSPALRRQAESVLAVRLEEMTVGERIALARRASHGIIAALRETGDGRVLRALLENRKLSERDVVGIASGPEVPKEVLGWLAAHPTWSGCHDVRLALAGNPRTPVPAALRLLLQLPRHDLQRIAGDSRVPQLVRVGAERHLVERTATAGEESEV